MGARRTRKKQHGSGTGTTRGPGGRTLQARRLFLLDSKGNRRISFDVEDDRAALSMYDGAGRLRLSMAVADDGEATLSLFSRNEPFGAEPDESKTVKRVVLGCLAPAPNCVERFGALYHRISMMFYDGEGRYRLNLGLNPRGKCNLTYLDQDGEVLNSFEVDPVSMAAGPGLLQTAEIEQMLGSLRAEDFDPNSERGARLIRFLTLLDQLRAR
jgi:hypothetical protein